MTGAIALKKEASRPRGERDGARSRFQGQEKRLVTRPGVYGRGRLIVDCRRLGAGRELVVRVTEQGLDLLGRMHGDAMQGRDQAIILHRHAFGLPGT